MNRFALGLLRRKLAVTLDSVSAFWYRMNQACNGVWLGPHAKIFGSKGITLGARTVIHNGAIVAATSLNADDLIRSSPEGKIRIGNDCQILPGAILASYGGSIVLGNHVSINPFTILYGHGGLQIGERTRIAAHVVLISANHIFCDRRKPIMLQGMSQKGISIGADVWIGTGARVLDGVTIGDGAVLAAGCVITKDIEPFSIVAGVPARTIGIRDESAHNLEKIESLTLL